MKDTLFYGFHRMMEEKGLITRTGNIVDASFVDVPKQRNNREENEKIKKGEVPEDCRQAENENKLAQKDVDGKLIVNGGNVEASLGEEIDNHISGKGYHNNPLSEGSK